MAVAITNLEASALSNGNETAKKECVIDKISLLFAIIFIKISYIFGFA